MAIQVTDSFNQLKIISGNIVQYYKYATVKSLSPVSDSNGDFAVIINFIVDDKNNPLILKMKDISNQATWINTSVGANIAIEAISDWMHTDNPSTNVTVEGWTGPLGQKTEAASIPVVIASDQTGDATRLVRITREVGSGSTGVCYAASFANTHATVDALVQGIAIRPGEVVSFDAGAINNQLMSITFNATGSELLNTIIV